MANLYPAVSVLLYTNLEILFCFFFIVTEYMFCCIISEMASNSGVVPCLLDHMLCELRCVITLAITYLKYNIQYVCREKERLNTKFSCALHLDSCLYQQRTCLFSNGCNSVYICVFVLCVLSTGDFHITGFMINEI